MKPWEVQKRSKKCLQAGSRTAWVQEAGRLMRYMDLSMNLQTDVKRPPIITVGFQKTYSESRHEYEQYARTAAGT